MKYLKRVYFTLALIPIGVFTYFVLLVEVFNGNYDDENYCFWNRKVKVNK